MKSILGLCRCKHPAGSLLAKGDAIKEKVDDDFEKVTYNLFCGKCRSDVAISHLRFIGGVDEFIGRGKWQRNEH